MEAVGAAAEWKLETFALIVYSYSTSTDFREQYDHC